VQEYLHYSCTTFHPVVHVHNITMTGNSGDDNDSDSSSSAGDCDYDSPDASDTEGGDGKRTSDDLFTYKPKEFRKQSDNNATVSSPTRRKRASKGIEEKLISLQRKKQARRQLRKDSFGDSSDDSSCPNSKPLARKVNNTQATSMVAASAQSSLSSKVASEKPEATTTQTISCLSSDDDDDDSIVEVLPSMQPKRPSSIPTALAATLQQAQQAKARLKQAQEYEAKDVNVAVEETEYVPAIDLTSPKRNHSATTNATKSLEGQRGSSLGKTLRFSCRIQIRTIVDSPAPKRGRRCKFEQQPQQSKAEQMTKTVKLRENENFEVLAKRLREILGDLPLATTKVVMRFDGCVLDEKKSPKNYEMEDEDMIEVSIEKEKT